jgi:dephospho-CoA kinase
MIRLGLTGSIGMGKSTTAKMFADRGIAVIDADAIVHDLYAGEAVAPIDQAFPGAVVDGRVDRSALSRLLAAEPGGFSRLEKIVHPLVWQREKAMLAAAERQGADIILLDIPLLYENGAEARVDKVVVVTCDAEIQRQRVLARPGMTEEKFEMIRNRQMPDVEKRRRADFLIDTGHGLAHAERRVDEIIEALRTEGKRHA